MKPQNPMKTKLASNLRYSLFVLLGALGLMQCKVGPNYERPEIAAPETFEFSLSSDTSTILEWFDVFQDTVLQNLIIEALENNKDLLTISSRVEAARIQAGIVKTFQLPSFRYDGTFGGGVAGINAVTSASGIDNELLKAQGTINWEIDLWGKLRRSTRAAQLEYLAAAENRAALQLSLVSEVASLYFLLCDLDNRLDIAQTTFESRHETTNILTERFDTGYISKVDVLQATQQEALAGSRIPSLQRQIVEVENALRVLLGRPPGRIARGEALFDQSIPLEVPSGLPSQLLSRRPDLRASENVLAAQNERIGIAEANRYPTLTLTGLLGLASPELSGFISDKAAYANAFAGLAGPIFEFGRNKKAVEVEKAFTEALVQEYQQTLLIALSEVENALNARQRLEEELAQRQIQVDAATEAFTLSRARYDFGYTDYLEVLVQENSLFDAQLQLSITQRRRLDALVDIYRALGGGW